MPGALYAQAERAITDSAGDLYRFQNYFHFSVFLVTAIGIPHAASRHREVSAELHPLAPVGHGILRRLAELPHTRVHELLPWNWEAARGQTLAA